jgi:hypothetical protein
LSARGGRRVREAPTDLVEQVVAVRGVLVPHHEVPQARHHLQQEADVQRAVVQRAVLGIVHYLKAQYAVAEERLLWRERKDVYYGPDVLKRMLCVLVNHIGSSS